MVDVASPAFWLLVIAGVLIINPVTHVPTRRALLAMANLGFLALLLGHRLPIVVAALVVIYALLQAAARPAIRPFAVTLTIGAAVLFFVLHKLPWISVLLHMGGIPPVLVAVGYSFFFLRLIDVLRATWEGRHPPPGPLQMVNYLLPFHMIAAGPIQAWDEFVDQPPVAPELSFEQAVTAIEWIVGGLFKKFVLAYAISAIFLTDGRARGFYGFIEMNLTYIWLYLDFSAYSDIAMGIGALIGVATPRNFNRPYLARNITDFWERWHISLSQWIRRNLFFPIQVKLVRRTEGKHALWCASIAIFISFLLCGAWHGLSLPFLWWGLANAGGLIVCNLYRHWLKKRLGTRGVARYLESTPIRILAVTLTFEFVAITVSLISRHWGGTS